jgi:hypothetical protein
MAAQGRPARSVEQQVAALVQTGSQLRVGDVFGSEVEGVQLAGGGAEPDGESCSSRRRVVADCGVASRANTCSRSPVAVRGRSVSDQIAACGSPSSTSEPMWLNVRPRVRMVYSCCPDSWPRRRHA